MTSLLLTFLVATLALVVLTAAVAASSRFRAADAALHARLVRPHPARLWHWLAFVFQPKLMVAWCFALAATQLPDWSRVCWTLAGLAGADLVGIFIKHTLRRSRPAGHLDHDDGYSYPSGHVLSASVLALMICQLFGGGPWLTAGLLVWWTLMVGSRLVLRAHYPSDALAATLLAVAWLALQNLVWLRLGW